LHRRIWSDRRYWGSRGRDVDGCAVDDFDHSRGWWTPDPPRISFHNQIDDIHRPNRVAVTLRRSGTTFDWKITFREEPDGCGKLPGGVGLDVTFPAFSAGHQFGILIQAQLHSVQFQPGFRA